MIAIIDYKMANLGSILNMLKRIHVQGVATSDPQTIQSADHIILPGVGAFDNAMHNLKLTGLIPLLREKVLQQRTPILGICLGMQLLGNSSDEGELPGLGWIEARCKKMELSEDSRLKIPHMGWAELNLLHDSPLLRELGKHPRYYFVHSYHMKCTRPEDVLATALHEQVFTAAVQKDNIYGVQFHPEKSHRFGLGLLSNFCRI